MTEIIANAHLVRHSTTIQLYVENKPAAKWPPPSSWDVHRDTIERLYLHENHTLEKVMVIMDRDYGHRGTVKMYKSHITKWGFHKYRKRSCKAAAPAKMQRQAKTKRSKLSVRVRPPGVNLLSQYLDRNLSQSRPFSLSSSICSSSSASSCFSSSAVAPPLTDHENFQKYWNAPQIGDSSAYHSLSMVRWNDVSPTVHYKEPVLVYSADISRNSSSTVSRQISDRKRLVTPVIPSVMLPSIGLLMPERLFGCITAYFSSSFGCGAWISCDDEASVSIGASGIVNNGSYRFYNYCRTASQLLIQGSPKQGLRLFSRACGLVPELLITQDVHTLSRLLDSLMYLEGTRLVGTAAKLQDVIYNVATRVLPRDHPWYHICKLITRPDPEVQHELLAQAWQCAIDARRRSSDEVSMATVQDQVELINRVYGNKDPSGGARRLNRLLQRCESIHGPNSAVSLKVLVVIGHNLIDQGKAMEAQRVADEVMDRAGDAGLWSHAYQLEAFELAAWAQFCQGKQYMAEHNLRKAIDGHAEQWGRDDTFLRRTVRLESWLRNWNRLAEAQELNGEIVELIGSSEGAM